MAGTHARGFGVAGVLIVAGALAAVTSGAAPAAPARELRVCADPDNLPYSNADDAGFENRIAHLLADEMHATLRYEWLPQRRGFVRKTMGAGLCDVFIGVPAGFERVLSTRPYYRSSYVFVYRPDRPLRSFDDPALRRLRIGVPLIGNDLAAAPPGYALAAKGAVDNVTGFTVYGDGPAAARMTTAIATGALDAGLLWGPQAGYYVRHAPTPLALSVARPPAGLDAVPFEFAIAMGVRRGDKALRDELDAIIVRRKPEIDAILAAWGVPRTDGPR